MTSSYKFLLSACALCALSVTANAQALNEVSISRPALIITNEPIPEHVRSSIYRKPSQARDIDSATFSGSSYYKPTQTLVTRKINELNADLSELQKSVASLTSSLSNVQKENESLSAEYHAAIATVNTQLQSGTTPGNPRLVKRLSIAENNLESLSGNITQLSAMAMNAADAASKASFLMESSRAAYDISGAVEEDHKDLTILEDTVANTSVIIERVLDDVNDDILRTNTYLNAERKNLQTLSLAVSNGDLYGRSLANVNYSNYQAPANFHQAAYSPSGETFQASSTASPAQPLPLAKIRFDRPNVNYQEPVYAAVNEALARYPNAQFDIIAIHPTQGNPAQIAIESTRARRNADKVLRTLSQMGLDLARTNLSYDQSPEATTSEVHIFVR